MMLFAVVTVWILCWILAYKIIKGIWLRDFNEYRVSDRRFHFVWSAFGPFSLVSAIVLWPMLRSSKDDPVLERREK